MKVYSYLLEYGLAESPKTLSQSGSANARPCHHYQRSDSKDVLACDLKGTRSMVDAAGPQRAAPSQECCCLKNLELSCAAAKDWFGSLETGGAAERAAGSRSRTGLSRSNSG